LRVAKVRGRAIVALVLIGFVLVATGVIWRRSVGVAQAREIQRLEQERADLVARRAALEAEIRDATGRARLARIAEQRLGMRVPSDSQVITLPRPARSREIP
jgi:cell division protein FtsL